MIRLLSLCCVFLVLVNPVVADDSIADPLEPMNRGFYWFNDQLDYLVLEPVAEGYDAVAPEFVKVGISNFYENVGYPKYFVSDLIQLKFGQALHHTGRFLINSTLGLGGLIDVADEFGLEEHREDFGTALAHHGVGHGAYLVVPFLGPSSIRDGFGKIVDSFLDPVSWVAFSTAAESDAWMITLGSRTVDTVDTRADLIEAINSGKEASLDFYLFSQSAYYQYRDALVQDKEAKRIPDNALEEEDNLDDWLSEDEEFEME